MTLIVEADFGIEAGAGSLTELAKLSQFGCEWCGSSLNGAERVENRVVGRCSYCGREHHVIVETGGSLIEALPGVGADDEVDEESLGEHFPDVILEMLASELASIDLHDVGPAPAELWQATGGDPEQLFRALAFG